MATPGWTRRTSPEEGLSRSPLTTKQTQNTPHKHVEAHTNEVQHKLTAEYDAEELNNDLKSNCTSPEMDDFAEDVVSPPGEQHDHASPKFQAARYTANGGYDALKSFNGQVYKGMAVGGSHTWNYDPGIWKETKEEPDLWKIDFETTKKRAKNAPKGSGAPIGTEYHWLIVAHQYVRKVDANTYSTHLVGSKYKLAHKNASSNSWSLATTKKQRDREVELLEDAIQRVHGLPPVLANEKVKVEKHEKGQQKLDALFSKTTPKKDGGDEIESKKRKRDIEGE